MKVCIEYLCVKYSKMLKQGQGPSREEVWDWEFLEVGLPVTHHSQETLAVFSLIILLYDYRTN